MDDEEAGGWVREGTLSGPVWEWWGREGSLLTILEVGEDRAFGVWSWRRLED